MHRVKSEQPANIEEERSESLPSCAMLRILNYFAQSKDKRIVCSAECLVWIVGRCGVVGEAAEFNLWHRISSPARAALATFIPHCPPHTFAHHTTFILSASPHIYHIEGGRMLHSYIMVTHLHLTSRDFAQLLPYLT